MSELCDYIREYRELVATIKIMDAEKDKDFVNPIKLEGTEQYITEEDAKTYKGLIAARAANRIAVNKKLEPFWKKQGKLEDQIMRLIPEVNLWVKVYRDFNKVESKRKYFFVRRFVNYQIEIKTGEEMEEGREIFRIKQEREIEAWIGHPLKKAST